VEPADPAALADAIESLIGNEGLRRQMGQAGARRARECFNWERVLDEVRSVYEKVQ